MKGHQFEEFARFMNMEMKQVHTIIDKWPWKIKKRPEERGAKEEFKTLFGSEQSGCERYVEWRIKSWANVMGPGSKRVLYWLWNLRLSREATLLRTGTVDKVANRFCNYHEHPIYVVNLFGTLINLLGGQRLACTFVGWQRIYGFHPFSQQFKSLQIAHPT